MTITEDDPRIGMMDASKPYKITNELRRWDKDHTILWYKCPKCGDIQTSKAQFTKKGELIYPYKGLPFSCLACQVRVAKEDGLIN